ncbi:MotA/TolQ/ExbB proton channel family protein [Marinicella sp. W31]|uniref:MotA/TolQ/ExbB proton channel family protein n=1 Tax=Marinicella sp. W31 TaxID=3023713 RepID=UPI0037577869
MKKALLMALLLAAVNVIAQEDTATEAVVQQPPVPAAQPEQAQEDLLAAYKKEYAFLTSQVRNIESRIAEFKQQSQRENNTMDGEILRLENALLALESQSDQLDQDIFEIQRTSESAEDNKGVLEATIQQAFSTMSEYAFDGYSEDSADQFSELDKMSLLVNKANDVIKEHSSITRSEGTFYLTDGTQVNGSIIKVGNIASYGNSPQGSGTLAPAGEKKFKIWRDGSQEGTAGIFSGQVQGSLPIFLYESSIKAIEEREEKTLLSVINSGGVIAWIIVGLGLFALLLILLRIWFLKSASASTEKLLNKVVAKIKGKDLDGAIQIASSKKSSSARVLSSALRNLNKDRDHIEDIVSESILHESSQLNRFGSLILVVATVAPLLGLLGTVTGMISTFDIITEFGTGDPKLLSEGISIALVTTEVGLAVAIPTLLFGNILSGWAERIKDDMEKAALRAINTYQSVLA